MIDFDKSDIIFLIMSAMCFMYIGYLASFVDIGKDTEKERYVPESEQEIINNCKNLNVIETAYCLRNEINTFFIYTITDDKIAKNMTLDEIKELGTDCGGYAYLYDRLTKELNINSTTNNYKGLKDVYPGHRWAVIWDDEDYCKLDQLKVECHSRD